MRRDVGFVLECGTPEFVSALDDAVVALMIEKQPAVENLEALLSVAGVDMVQFGPADYSMSIGLTGQFTHPRVKEAQRYVIEYRIVQHLPDLHLAVNLVDSEVLYSRCTTALPGRAE